MLSSCADPNPKRSMDADQDDTIFLRLSPFLALFAAWSTWQIIQVMEDEQAHGVPPLKERSAEVPGPDEGCGATWVVSVPEIRCRGALMGTPSSEVVSTEPYRLSLSPLGGMDAPSTEGSSCTLRCTGGEVPRSELVLTVAAPAFRGRARCTPSFGEAIDLYIGPVYTETGASIQYYPWRLNSDALSLWDRLLDSCPYLRPTQPGDVPSKDGLW